MFNYFNISIVRRSPARKIIAGFSTVLLVLMTVGMVPPAANADAVTLSPNGIGNYDQWSVNAGTKTDAVATDDGDDTYIEEDDNNKRQTFTVSNAGIPAGSTINKVTLFVVAKGTGSGSSDKKIVLGVENGGALNIGTDIVTNVGYTTHSREMTTNPLVGGAWTLSEVNSWTTKFGVARSSANGTVRVTRIYVEVDYTPPSSPPGTIIIVKETIGGDDVFSFEGDLGEFDIETEESEGEATFSGLEPGIYSVAEGASPDWDLTSASCDDDSDPSEIDLGSNETVTCTFVNTKLGKIIIEKQTLPNGADQSFDFETNYSDDFSLTDGGTNDSGFLEPGTYSVSEDIPGDWDLTSASCDDDSDPSEIDLDPGETVTCTFTNTQRGHIIVEKTAIPDDDTDFDFNASYNGDGFSLSDGEENDSGALEPGTYSVSEVADDDYNTVAACSDGSDPSEINLAPGETVTCTFTNFIKQGGISVVKQTFPDESEEEFDFESNFAGDFTLMDGESEVADELDPDEYSVSEDVPDGWELSIDCEGSAEFEVDGNSVSINLGPDEDMACVFTNTQHGQLIVQKTTNPSEDDTEFSIEASGTGTVIGGGAGAVTDTADKNYEVTSGTYSVSEDVPEGWVVSSNNCEGVEVGPGATEECTIVNTKLGKIKVDKVTDPEESNQEFIFDPSYGDGNFTLTDIQTPNDSGFLAPGTYSVSEINIPDGWELTSATCSDDSDPSEINLAPGETVTCTFTNAFSESVPPPPPEEQDVCPNIEGTQTSVPNGFHIDSGNDCIGGSTGNGGGGGGGFFGNPNDLFGGPPAGGSGGGTVLGASTVVPQVLGESCSILVSNYIGMGRKNNPDEVKKLQQFLNENLGLNPPLPITGFYGPLTLSAVNQFQMKYWEEVLAPWVAHGLPTAHTPTGYVYKTTKRWINKLSCNALDLPIPPLP